MTEQLDQNPKRSDQTAEDHFASVFEEMFPRRYPERFDTFLCVLVMALTFTSGTIIVRYVICALIPVFVLVRFGYEYETWHRFYGHGRETAWDAFRNQWFLLLLGSSAVGYFWHFECLFSLIILTGIYIWRERVHRSL